MNQAGMHPSFTAQYTGEKCVCICLYVLQLLLFEDSDRGDCKKREAITKKPQYFLVFSGL